MNQGKAAVAVIDTTGPYDGVVLLGDADQLQVHAEGPWRIELRSLYSAPDLGKHTTGRGDQMLAYTGPRGVLNATHDGTRTFAITVINADGAQTLLTDEGAYSGRVSFPAGTAWVLVRADGNWTPDIT